MKSLKEAAQQYSNECWGDKADKLHIYSHTSIGNITVLDFKAGAEFAQRWISVDKELPIYIGERFHILTKLEPDFELYVYLIESQDDIDSIKTIFTHWRYISFS